jgi:hypothetical protein
MFEGQGSGGKIVAVMLMIAMVRCGLRVHPEVEIEWKVVVIGGGSNGIGLVAAKRMLASPRLVVSAGPNRWRQLFCSPPQMREVVAQDSISSRMVASIKSGLETIVPMRNAG